MVQIQPKPILLIDTLVTLAVVGDTGDNFEKYFNRSELVPSGGGAVTFQGGTPDATYSFPAPVSWAWETAAAQDFDTAGGLGQFLWDNKGELVDVTIAPRNGGTTWAFQAFCPTPGAGGTIGSVATNALSWPIQGEPVPTFPTVTP